MSRRARSRVLTGHAGPGASPSSQLLSGGTPLVHKIYRRSVLVLVAVFILCPALVLSNGTKADALVGPVTVPVAALDALGLSGGTAGVATAGRLALITNPYGLAISAVLLGAGLYATRDSWLPYVTGTLGKDGATGQQPLVPTGSPCPAFVVFAAAGGTPSGTSAGSIVLLRNTCAQSSDAASLAFTFTALATCRNANGSITTQAMKQETWGVRADSATSGVWAGPIPLGQCAAGGQVLDVRVIQGPGSVGPLTGLTWQAGASDLGDLNISTTVKCVNASGQVATVTLNGSASKGFPVPSCEARLGDGWHGTEIATTGGYPGGNQNDILKANPDDGTYAQCVGPTAACKLAVWLDGTICTAARSDCQNWPSIITTSPTRLACKWGPYSLALVDCQILERAYLPNPQPCTTVGSCDGDPATDPVPTPTPTTTTSPSPTVTTTGGADPGPTGTPPVETSPPPESTPTENSDCWPSGWGALNPASWVLRPVKCALRWAFVPRSSVLQTTFTDIQTDTAGTAPGQWIGAVSGLGDDMQATAAGCLGPALDMSWTHLSIGTIYPFSACDPPMSYVAAAGKAFLSIACVWGGGLACIRVLGAGFGYAPSIGRAE